MTKRSVALVGVLILMVMIGSLVIGSFAGRAAPDESNGSSTVYLPLIMKLLAPLGATDIYMAGNIQLNYQGFSWAHPQGIAQANQQDVGYRMFFSPQGECTAQEFRAEILPYLGTTFDADYEFEMNLAYVGINPELLGVKCLMTDPETTCLSTNQLVIPANSKIYILIRSLKINYGEIQIPFSWVCK